MPAAPSALPPGFARGASGLILPAEVSRERQAWTHQEFRDVERATKLLTSRGIGLFLKCDHPGCPNPKIERLRNLDGSVILRCGHRDRVFTKAY